MDPKQLMLPAAAGMSIHESTASTSSTIPQNVAPSDTVSRALATISDLLPNPREYAPRKSHARKKSPGHVPRPANPFILFRTAFVRSGHIPTDVEPDHRNLSRIAGEVWRRMTPAEKKKWNDLADEVKEEHKRVHPNYRYQPDFHRPEPVRRRKTRRRVIVKEVETDSTSDPGEDSAAIQTVEEDATSVQAAPVSPSYTITRNASSISAAASTSKTKPGPCKRKAGVNMRAATGQPAKIKVRTVIVPERPREYLSKVAALVHAGHNGDALIQAVQSAPVSAPASALERPVEWREQHPPRQQRQQPVSLSETQTPGELMIPSPRVSEVIRQEDVNASMETDEWDPLEVPTDNYVYDGNAEADLAEFLRFTSDHDMSSEAWSIYVEDGVSATPSKPFPVLEPRTVKIPPLIVGKDSYGSNGKKFRYGPPPRYLPPMEPGLLSGARVPWTLSPSDHAHDPFLGPYKRAASPTKQLPLLYSSNTVDGESSTGSANARMTMNTGTNGTNMTKRMHQESSTPPSPTHNHCGAPARNGLLRDMLGTEPGGSSPSSAGSVTRTKLTNLARSALEGVRRPSLPSSHIPGLDYIPIMQ